MTLFFQNALLQWQGKVSRQLVWCFPCSIRFWLYFAPFQLWAPKVKVKFPELFATNIIGKGTWRWHWWHLRPSQKISQHVSSYNSIVPVPGKAISVHDWSLASFVVLRTYCQVGQDDKRRFLSEKSTFHLSQKIYKASSENLVHIPRIGFHVNLFLHIGHDKIDIYMYLMIPFFFPWAKPVKNSFNFWLLGLSYGPQSFLFV